MSEQKSAVYTAEQEEQNKLKRAYLDGYYKGCQDTQKAAPRWVRCEEAKPQNKTRCLLAIPTAAKSPDYKHYYEIGYYDGGHFTAYNSELGFIQLEPEWWMPIEPPKEDA